MSTSTGISPHAHAFLTSYARATALSSPGTPSSLRLAAHSMSQHYLPNLTSFTLGTTTTIATQEEAAKGTELHLKKLVKAGVGADIRVVRKDVKEIGEFAAGCWVTWELVVKDEEGVKEGKGKGEGKEGKGKGKGKRSWRWKNAYGYRRMVGPDGKVKEGFEYIVSDEEVSELVKNVPGYFEL